MNTVARASTCTSCGTTGAPKKHTPGSTWLEFVLWLCVLFPGLFYSLWRLAARRNVCASCGSAQLVPSDSPVGRRIAGSGVSS